MNCFASIVECANEYSGLISLVALIVVPIGAFFSWHVARHGTYSARERLESRADWPQLIVEFNSPAIDRYFNAVARVLAFAERVYGKKSISWQAFNRCLSFAFLYPIIAAFLAWVLFDVRNAGGLEIATDEVPAWRRTAAFALMVAGSGAAWWIFANAYQFSTWFVDRVWSLTEASPARPSFFAKAGRAGLEVGAFAGAVAFAAAVAFAGAFAGAFAVAFAFAGAVAFAGAFSFAGVFAGAFAFAGAVGGAVGVAVAVAVTAVEIDLDIFGAVVFFYFLLPFCNASADMASLAITRGFLSRYFGDGMTSKRPGTTAILVQFVLDLCLAVICLILLLAGMVGLLELWSWLHPVSTPLDWDAYWKDAGNDWRNGTALWLMVATTLVPTFVHLVAGVGAILTHRLRMRARVAKTLQAALDECRELTVTDRSRMLRTLSLSAWFGYGIAVVLAVGILVAGFALYQWSASGVEQEMQDISVLHHISLALSA